MKRSPHQNSTTSVSDTDVDVAEPTVTSATPSRRPSSKLVRKVVALAVGVLASAAVVIPSASPAGAIAGGENTAKCLRNSMSADFFFYDQSYPGWSIVSTPWLFKWDAARATFVANRAGYPQWVGGVWSAPSTEYFNNLSPGYYRMFYVEQWYSGGVLRSTRMIQAARHIVIYGGYSGYTSNTYKYSDWKTYSYCYEGN